MRTNEARSPAHLPAPGPGSFTAPRITQAPGPASCQSESGVKTGKTKGKTEKESVFEQTARCEGHTTIRLTHSQLGRQSSLRTKTEATSFSVRLSSPFCFHHLLTDAFTAHTPPRRAPQERFSRETREPLQRLEDYVTHKPLLPQRKRRRSRVTRSRDLSHRLRQSATSHRYWEAVAMAISEQPSRSPDPLTFNLIDKS